MFEEDFPVAKGGGQWNRNETLATPPGLPGKNRESGKPAQESVLSLYELVNVHPDASMQEIVQGFQREIQIHHPESGGDVKTFRRLRHARDVLTDPGRRHAYDTYGQE